MNIHPLVRFIFFLAFSFSVLFADTLTLWAIYFGIFVVTTGFDRTVILAVFSRIKPFILFFPFMLVCYLAVSVIFTDATIYQAMVEVGFAFLRIVLMIRRPPRSTPLYSSAASDVYKRQMFIFILKIKVKE